jgi:UDP-xylose/UDP-N-acetylglucosamine transporter B4
MEAHNHDLSLLKGSLIANMILGVIILKKRYKFREYASIVMITIGILICTFESSDLSHLSKSDTESQNAENFFWWIVGTEA